MTTVKKVHVIFKTHLDMGFTDLAANVVDKYMKLFIPQALSLAERMEREDGQSKFIWTVGSWLIEEYLQTASEEQRNEMEQAIRRGEIAWHGLPFTTHTELMDQTLLEYGVSISKKLDQRYGKKTIAAKMSDVPGHSIGIVPILAKYGIRYLHVGINPSCKPPCVPKAFVWRASGGSELIVNYADDYGQALKVEGLEDVLYFAHTGDNMGPPSIEEIEGIYRQLQSEYPDAEIVASTLDAFAEKLLQCKDVLPVVTEEIGDTWIQGTASDPLKVARFRELLRLRDKWVSTGSLDPESESYGKFCNRLLLIPEHTWGLDEKKYLSDNVNYAATDFKAARLKDHIKNEELQGPYYEFNQFARMDRSYRHFESSWEEQRAYLEQAVSALSLELQIEAKKALDSLNPVGMNDWNDGEDIENIEMNRVYTFGKFHVSFASDGSIDRLVDTNGKVWADEDNRLAVYRYETFGKENYDRYFKEYTINLKQHFEWAIPDHAKPGIEFAIPVPENKQYRPILRRLQLEKREGTDKVYAHLEMPTDSSQYYGAPHKLVIIYTFHHSDYDIDVELNWMDKPACRLPEASWFSFVPSVDNPNKWTMDKLGSQISPLTVVKNGNRNMHAVNSELYYEGADGNLIIETLDAPIVCPGETRLLQFNNTFAPLEGGFHFNLHNNVWGTNFRMWFEEDMKFRFRIRLRSNR
ncbi:DUF5054 domain-containing protein [Paenibacillus macquariensis]|uniref:Glycoside hydrolase n=1 Tax=Paenibacillus macquariensis TaxID=948756 RepID=A0ABY1JUZ9_9BACL|nr:DUF5054 domain-containing protein [Paenibacillus macquariensis]MEC0090861.1 DUF5054 domain-containing protein [Paenibacillus macquariensis]OAB34595.1 glycoside hydrolase [Paenibacillus macquariensis subsp. macquariensis]SIQ81938.1 protein of unknown function [Paenibacillus macquariensis]